MSCITKSTGQENLLLTQSQQASATVPTLFCLYCVGAQVCPEHCQVLVAAMG
ncbi:hypothetical protein [Photobacterium sp. TY1-4]|uniref:hypothetical protein n=1 Tax=Photobacterium sp. TY1-4 TaxID=2899122 RepID=UPI0021BE4169|nr:hypothetical protein [Photobacterium sp. TY1-4]UXI03541.1 hypothetical protein NH461_24280 [Photobacterium sp. TY1-4]